MRRVLIVAAFVLCMCCVAASAQEPQPAGFSPLQLSIFPPIQLRSSDTAIAGLRLGLFSKNIEMTGLDVGLLNWTSQDLTALQWGIVNYTGGNVVGVQWGLVSITGKRFIGWQASAYNWNVGDTTALQSGLFNGVGSDMLGVQFGAVNYAHSATGLQLGLVNITHNLSGIQLGILNIATGKEHLPVLPILNASF